MNLEGSILIYGGDRAARNNKILELLGQNQISVENNPDVLNVRLIEDKKSIGIGTVKDNIKALGQKPFSHKYKILIIWEADLMTIEAQNTLLKILEEPPEYATIILCAPTKTAVLPTILSRCKRVELKSKAYEDSKERAFFELFQMSLGDRMSWAAEVSKEDREVVIDIVKDLILDLEISARTEPTMKAAQALVKLSEVRNDLLKTNVNLKLALEYLVLSV